MKVFLREKPMGEANIFTENKRLFIEFSCPADMDYIYRLTVSANGETLNIGVMTVEKGRFYIKKRLDTAFCGPSGEKIEKLFIAVKRIGGKGCPPFDFCPSDFKELEKDFPTSDEALLSAVQRGGLMKLEYMGDTYIMAPYDGKREFLLAAFFSVVRIWETAEGVFAVMRLDGENAPRPF